MAYEQNDIDALKMAMHSLKSSSRQFGAMRLGDIAEKLETLANEKRLKEMPVFMTQLSTIERDTLACLEQQLKP